MFGNRAKDPVYMGTQQRKQVASRHQQILKDYKRRYNGPLQKTMAKWCSNKRGYAAMHNFLSEVGSMAVSRTGYTFMLNKLTSSYMESAALMKAANIDSNCAIQLAFDNINWKNKKAQKDRMHTSKNESDDDDDDIDGPVEQHHNYVLLRWDSVPVEKLLARFPDILKQDAAYYDNRSRANCSVVPCTAKGDFDIVKTLGYSLVKDLLDTKPTVVSVHVIGCHVHIFPPAQAYYIIILHPAGFRAIEQSHQQWSGHRIWTCRPM